METTKKRKELNKISDFIFIDKYIPNSRKTKKSQLSMDLIIKKRSNSLRVIPSKKVISNSKANNKIFKSMNMKNQQTTQKIHNLEELSKSVKENGVNETNNYLYLKKLKENKDKKFAEEFEQYKYTLSYEKRIELSINPKKEINMSLKQYFEEILLLILINQNNFDANKELEKFNLDFDKFGILINPKYNIELFYCLMIYKFLDYYKILSEEQNEPEFYLSFLKNFIEGRNVTPITSLILIWIIITIYEEDSIEYIETKLQNYNLILTKNEKSEIFIKTKFRKKNNFIYNYQIITEDNKNFIKNSYYGDNFYIIYKFFKNVICSPLLKCIYSSIEGFESIIKNYDFSDITAEKIILFPMFLSEKTYGFTQTYFDIVLINSSPVNKKFEDVVSKIHNYFFLYVTILHEQGFHYIRLIFNKLNPEIDRDTPKQLFLNLTNDPVKLALLKGKNGDAGDKAEIIIFGIYELNLKQILYFSNLNNYSKKLYEIEKEINDLNNIEEIKEEDIENSFFKNILTEEEKQKVYQGNYDKEMAKNLSIKCKKSKEFTLPITYGKDKERRKYKNNF